MRKVTYICDLCGKEYKNRNWTLERDTHIVQEYSTNRKVIMEICGDCAKWIKRQRGERLPYREEGEDE